MKILAERIYSFVLFDNGTDWILTFLIGGVAEVDVSIRLTKEEMAMIQENPSYLETLVEAARTNRAAYGSREIYPPVWPNQQK